MSGSRHSGPEVRGIRGLGLQVGALPPGRLNAITDVGDVSVGQAGVAEEGLDTGITAVVPYPPAVRERQLFVGRYAVDGGEMMTGLGVTEDFGTFSTPIVLAPSVAVGQVYDALIQYGLARDRGLSTHAGWPPIVVGVDDSWWNPPPRTYRQIREEHLDRALESAVAGPVAEGNAGIGGGLCAFGVKGGVGTSSRVTGAVAGGAWTVGALVAANGGAPDGLCVDRHPVGPVAGAEAVESTRPQTFAAVVATDAPLRPGQLDRLAARAALGLTRVGLLDAFTREGAVLAFSTTGIGPAAEGGAEEETVSMVGEEGLHHLFMAGGEACEEAVLNALLAAAPLRRLDRSLPILSPAGWPERVRRHQDEVRSGT